MRRCGVIFQCRRWFASADAIITPAFTVEWCREPTASFHDDLRAAVAADLGILPDQLAPHLARLTRWMINGSKPY